MATETTSNAEATEKPSEDMDEDAVKETEGLEYKLETKKVEEISEEIDKVEVETIKEVDVLFSGENSNGAVEKLSPEESNTQTEAVEVMESNPRPVAAEVQEKPLKQSQVTEQLQGENQEANDIVTAGAAEDEVENSELLKEEETSGLETAEQAHSGEEVVVHDENGAKTATAEEANPELKEDPPANGESRDFVKADVQNTEASLSTKELTANEPAREEQLQTNDMVKPEQPTKDSDKTKKASEELQQVPAKTKQSHNILMKLKQSLVKAKKAIIGKSPSSKTVSSEVK